MKFNGKPLFQSFRRMVCPPSHASPASRVCHPDTDPASTQIIFLYASSGEKSAISFAFWLQGFQTTMSFNDSREMEKSSLLSEAEAIIMGIVGSRDWYTRSVSSVMAT